MSLKSVTLSHKVQISETVLINPSFNEFGIFYSFCVCVNVCTCVLETFVSLNMFVINVI